MNVTKHSSKNSLLKELKKQLEAGGAGTGPSQVAITLEEDEGDSSKNVYMLVVHGMNQEENKEETQ